MLLLDWTGDPLTPYQPALPLSDKNTPERLNADEVGLHTIPVTPIAYGAADHIFKHMKGKKASSTRLARRFTLYLSDLKAEVNLK